MCWLYVSEALDRKVRLTTLDLISSWEGESVKSIMFLVGCDEEVCIPWCEKTQPKQTQ